MNGDPFYEAYHDHEWGVPEWDSRALWEKLVLDGFQAGLSWITILRKRVGFREAFRGFVVEDVAAMDETDVKDLLAMPQIVRHRGKITATIANARAVLAMRDAGTSLVEVVWSHAPHARDGSPERREEIPAQTESSIALSRELRRWGMRFVGPTTTYAFMQSAGLVDDHLAGCHRAGVGADSRRRAPRPDKVRPTRPVAGPTLSDAAS